MIFGSTREGMSGKRSGVEGLVDYSRDIAVAEYTLKASDGLIDQALAKLAKPCSNAEIRADAASAFAQFIAAKEKLQAALDQANEAKAGLCTLARD